MAFLSAGHLGGALLGSGVGRGGDPATAGPRISPPAWLGLAEGCGGEGSAWMSSAELELRALRHSVDLVVQALRGEIGELRDRVADLESRLSGANLGAPPTPLTSPITVNYTQVGSPPTTPVPFARDPEQVPVLPSGGSGLGAGQRVRGHTEAERRAVAIGVGHFLRRSLDGVRRGDSGRASISLPSTHYVLCRDIRGNLYNPVQVHTSFGSIRPLVKLAGSCQDSIFVGLPSLWEAQLAVESAGLLWPRD